MDNSSKSKLVAIVGATATGKTTVGVKLALALNGEVINCDSSLFYRGMDIATSKPSMEEMSGVQHHLMDFLEPDQNFSLAEYLKIARTVVCEVTERGNLPILVGGSGQYFWALVEGWKVPNIEPDLELRAELELRLTNAGVESIAQILCNEAPGAAKETDLRNPRRVIRAIERIRSGWSDSARRKSPTSPFQSLIIGLSVDRAVLHQRIIERLHLMLERGWKSEVDGLLARGFTTKSRSMNGIGYRHMIDHISGKFDLDEAVRLTAVSTNKLVRHQNSWFKTEDPRIHWYNVTKGIDAYVESMVTSVAEWQLIRT